MTNFTILDKNKHRDLRVITDRGAEFGENTHLVPVIAEELHTLILEYPVCLLKNDDTGQFGLHALLGFEAGENLFLTGDTWHANYLPAHIKRQPFMVMVQGEEGDAPSEKNTMISINLDSSRVQEDRGELLFDENGDLTPYMNEINALLGGLVNGIIQTDNFIHMLSALDLIEPIQLTVTFKDKEEKRFDGLFSINAPKLAALDADNIKSLHEKGYLQACYLIMASMGNVQKLISLKRQKNNNQ